jgi:hypothetical protein
VGQHKKMPQLPQDYGGKPEFHFLQKGPQYPETVRAWGDKILKPVIGGVFQHQ